MRLLDRVVCWLGPSGGPIFVSDVLRGFAAALCLTAFAWLCCLIVAMLAEVA